MKRRCAIVECYNRHDEVYLTTVYLLNQLGYDVDVFTTFRNRTKNSFIYAGKLNHRLHYRFNASALLEPANYAGFDLVVFNTFEGAPVLAVARTLIDKTPLIGFIHNGSFVRRPEYRFFAGHHRFKFAVLAPYVQQAMADVADAFCIYPMFFHDGPVPTLPAAENRIRFCVQGYFDSTRRQYSLLVDALQQLAGEGVQGFEVTIMGRSFSADFRSFHRDVRRRGLGRYINYTWKGIGYATYYRLLNSIDYIMPLVSRASHPEYFVSKVTSSVAAATGFGKACVLDETLAGFYGIESASFTYTDDLAGAMRKALRATDDDRAALRRRVLAIREERLRQSVQQLGQAIDQVTQAARTVPAAL